jgi:hypothetical protein
MHVNSSWRRVAVALGAIAATTAMFATPASAKPSHPAHPLQPGGPYVVAQIDCSDLPNATGPMGEGIVPILSDGVAKGHCFFPNGFPELGNPPLPAPGPANNRAVNDSCADLAIALGVPLVPGTTPTGNVTLTPSGNANVNCRDVFLDGNGA